MKHDYTARLLNVTKILRDAEYEKYFVGDVLDPSGRAKMNVEWNVENPRGGVEYHAMPAALITAGENIMTAAWHSPVSSDPFLWVVSIRKERHTYTIVKELGDMGICIMPFEFTEAVHLCGRKSGRNTDKFKAAGLTHRQPVSIQSKLIAEALICYEGKVINEFEAGDHQLFLVEIVKIHRRADFDAKTARPSIYVGNGLYGTVSEAGKF